MRSGGRGGAPGVVRAWWGAPGVVRAWRGARGATWCTKSRRSLYLRSLCTKSHAFFRSWPAPTWCTKSRESLYLRSLCTNSPAFLHPWPGGRGASPLAIPRYPLFLRPEAPRLRAQTKSDAPRLPPSCITFPLLYFQRERIDDEHHPPSFRRQF